MNVEGLMVNENTTLQITDMLGNIHSAFKTQQSTFSIDVSNLNEGIYNLSIISNEGTVNKRVVIVK